MHRLDYWHQRNLVSTLNKGVPLFISYCCAQTGRPTCWPGNWSGRMFLCINKLGHGCQKDCPLPKMGKDCPLPKIGDNFKQFGRQLTTNAGLIMPKCPTWQFLMICSNLKCVMHHRITISLKLDIEDRLRLISVLMSYAKHLSMVDSGFPVGACPLLDLPMLINVIRCTLIYFSFQKSHLVELYQVNNNYRD